MTVSFVMPIYPFDAYVVDMAARALQAVRDNSPAIEIIAVHNGGLPEGEALKPLADKYIHLEPNQGYSPAVNAGLEAATGDILVVGSHDVFVQPGWLPPVIGAIEGGLSIACPVIPHPRWQKWTGALFAMPRHVYEIVGPLDEGALRYRYGEQDFAIRAHMKGFRIGIVPESHFLHDRSGVRSIDLHPEGRVAAEMAEMKRRHGADRYRNWLKLQAAS